MATRRSFRHGRVPQRRKTVWARTSGILTLVAGTPQRFDLLGQFETAVGAQILGATVTRGRGWYTWQTSGTLGTAQRTNLGVIVAPEASTAAVLDPNATTGTDLDWMYFQAHTYAGIYLASGNVGTPSQAKEYEYEFDMRARRRMDELNQSLWLVANSITADGVLRFNISTLLMLP